MEEIWHDHPPALWSLLAGANYFKDTSRITVRLTLAGMQSVLPTGPGEEVTMESCCSTAPYDSSQ